ncbi:MAG: sugar nucleotide-binding protein, partial [Flavobacteriales bacterium]|nr:sugar nucleotide-binding protein [Flavobacteriales bacterium]
MARQRILITGSNGLLGQKLIAALRDDDGTDLIATSRGEDRSTDPLGDRYRSLDITDKAAVQAVFDEVRPEAVIHTAAMTNVDACELDAEACRIQNVEATRHLVEAARELDSHF